MISDNLNDFLINKYNDNTVFITYKNESIFSKLLKR